VPKGALRIAAANLYVDNDDPTGTTTALVDAHPDVLVVVEYTGNNLDAAVLDAAGYHVAAHTSAHGVSGAGVVVRDGFAATATVVPALTHGTCTMPLSVTRIGSGESALTLLGVHAPPRSSGCVDSLEPNVRALAELVAGGHLARDLGAGRAGDRVVVAGDLNTVPFQEELGWLLDAGLTDAKRGGPAPTWPARPGGLAVLRVDYVLLGDGIAALGAGRIRVPGSDHHAVYADVGPRR
jgi:hypothetical protein